MSTLHKTIGCRLVMTARSILLLGLCLSSGCQIAGRQCIPAELFGVNKTTTVIDAFRPTPQFDRHDPSNVIRHEDRYWVFYTRNLGDHKEVSVQVACSPDGYQWTDLGEAIGRGAEGQWDESGAIAPYCVHHEGKFYLFYTGFRDGNLATRELGCAIADSPKGPWTRWHRNPILRRNPAPAAWDSAMLGDSNVIFREGKWWLYFKSRRDTETNKDTRIGVAVADQITGPYRKHPANPLFAGHAFSAWRHRDGVAALCGEITPKIKWSPDGLHFLDAGEMPNQSTGLFAPDAGSNVQNLQEINWGLEVYTEAGARGLRRFDCAAKVAVPVPKPGTELNVADYGDSPTNPAMQPIQGVAGLPSILLIGDSISIGYTLPVRERLAGKGNVHRIPENGGSTTNGLASLDAWLGTQHWNVIHFNWGLHDLKLMGNGQQQVSLPDYERNLDQLVQRLKQTGAQLVWASTTPVPEGKLKTPRRPEDVPSYNAAARRVMERHGVAINDLYAFALPQLSRIQIPTNVHFTKEGSAVLAKPVAEAILTSLKNATAAEHRRPGLVGPWYGNADFTRAKGSDLLQTMAPEFDSETGFGSSWSAMWEGELVSPASKNVTFRVTTSGRVTVEIANTKVLETKDGLGTGTLEMVRDRAYPIKVYYSHRHEGKGSFRIEWSWPGREPELIPESGISHTAAQEDYWNWRPEPNPATLDRSDFTRAAGKQVAVFEEPGRFTGWPANNGLWSWGSEILVGFSLGYHRSNSGGGHAIDPSKPQVRAFARSLDGGETWQLEQPHLPMNRRIPEVPLKRPINFAHPDFAMRCFDSSFIVSYDRGRTWQGRYKFSQFPTESLTSRTDYLVSGSNTCTVFLSAEEKGVQVDEYSDRAFCARTTDGGLSWRFLGWMTSEPIGVRSVMPATVRVSDTHLVSALRRRIDRGLGGQRPPVTENWIDAYESKDNGTTWNFLSRVGDTDRGKHNGNPPAMVRLRDGRLVVAYGYRGIPYGIRARISKDNGATWGDIIHLREDAATWDMGYCRMVECPDGKLVTIYYYNTPEHIEQHIAATIWDPGAVEYPPKTHGPELKVWAVPSAQKIFRDDDQPVGAAAQARLEAAGNETESAQVALRAEGGDRILTNATLATFAGVGGAVSSIRAQLMKVEYVYLPDLNRAWPDALPPLKCPLALREGLTQPIWLSVDVPASTPAGNYQSTLRLDFTDGVSRTIPVRLRVRGFNLPERPSMRTAIGNEAWEFVLQQHGIREGTPEAAQLKRNYYRFFIERRISPYLLPCDLFDPEAAQWLDDPRLTSFVIPYSEDDAVLRRTIEHLKKNNWLEKGFFYIWDEPVDPVDFEAIRRRALRIHAIEPGARINVPFNSNPREKSGQSTYERMDGSVNLWCPMSTALDEKAQASRAARGDDSWWYVCCAPKHPKANLMVHWAGAAHRVLFWQQKQRGINGFLYWSAVYWDPKFTRDPWTNIRTFEFHGGAYGDGSLVYPGDRVGINGPVTSIRLELLRDGMDDFDYLTLFEKLRGKEAMQALIARATTDLNTYTTDPLLLDGLRGEMAEALAGNSSGGR